MAAGLVTLNILDGDGTTRTARFWSSDGTTAGLLYSPAVVLDSSATALDYTVTTPVGQIGVYPNTNVGGVATAATPVSASSGNVAAASAAATLAGVASKTTYISGFSVTASGATSALVVNITLTNAISGTMTWAFTFPAGVTASATPLVVEFCPPIPASATNTAMVLTLPSGGAGNTNASVNAWGFQL